MADTSFHFGTDVSSDDNLLSPDEADCLDIEEEEYDIFNDETFGPLEDASGVGDWEQEHEQFAVLAESSKSSERLENSLNKLTLEDSNYLFPTSKNSVWSYNAPQNGENINSPLLSSVQKAARTLVEPAKSAKNETPNDNTLLLKAATPPVFDKSPNISSQLPKKFCTVEELERGLLQNRNKVHSVQSTPSPAPMPAPVHPQPQLPPHSAMHPLPSRLPPGLAPMNMHHPHLRHMHHMHPNLPPGLIRLLPPTRYMQGNHNAQSSCLMYPPQFPMNHPFNFPPPPRIGNPIHNMPPHQNNRMNHHQNNQYQRNKADGGVRHRNEQFEQKDEYAGLMSNREKQWLINIQLVQLNTGTPYFDDYYYTIFKERKAKNCKENQPPSERNQWHIRRGNDRQETQNTLTPKVYTPLQFENSLGKLQCGSVTAPRKIIDMDIVTPDKDAENNSNSSRDTKKTKQLLLELEAFYSLVLKAEDIRNPLYKSNMEKLCEIRQKQRLRELELASTTEQKQEILKALRQESEPLTENPHDYLQRVLHGLFQEDKYVSFLGIRKGKMLLLRILPHLMSDNFSSQLAELWTKVFLSIPVVGRKDTAGDHLFLRLNSHFKWFIQSAEISVILGIVSNLSEVPRLDNTRGTPISCQGKPPLNFIVANKFGMSALASILLRVECLISSEKVSEKQQNDWSSFVVRWAESLLLPKLTPAAPIEWVPAFIFNKHCGRIASLSADKRKALEKRLTEGN